MGYIGEGNKLHSVLLYIFMYVYMYVTVYVHVCIHSRSVSRITYLIVHRQMVIAKNKTYMGTHSDILTSAFTREVLMCDPLSPPFFGSLGTILLVQNYRIN